VLITLAGTWLDANEVGEEMEGASWMVRKMEVNLYTSLLVMAFVWCHVV